MNKLITFSIEMLLVSATFYLGYLIIKNNTTPTFKRFYLLAWLLFSVAFPLISIESDQSLQMNIGQIVNESSARPQPNLELEESQGFQLSQEPTGDVERIQTQDEQAKKGTNWKSIIKTGYLVIACFFLLQVLYGVLRIIKLRANSKPIEEQETSVFLVNDLAFKGASFFGWIFIGKAIDEDRDVIIRHERIHYKLGHSLDILISHIYCAIFWINPFSWILKKHIGLNSELEADARMIQSENRTSYGSILLSLSQGMKGPKVMNHFSAFHLKSRITALTKTIRHKKWVSIFSVLTIMGLFFTVSCENVNSSEVMVERMNEVKTITTRFTSHQSDTQQKTGKIVAIASFLPDGTLDELVEQTTYPYDREFEVKKSFWDTPDKTGLPFVMDGLSLGGAEKTFLYGNDWPSAYYKHLYERSQSSDMAWPEILETDDETLPTEIHQKLKRDNSEYVIGMPDRTEYFEYEDQKVMRILSQSIYPELDDDVDERTKEFLGRMQKKMDENMTKERKEMVAKMRENSGKIKLTTLYTYDGDLLTSIKEKEYERKFYYENNLLVKSEYYRAEELLNTRIHYYKNSLKDRTEIFNRYNEPEFTITYEYEFW